jgi:hypothetical protein
MPIEIGLLRRLRAKRRPSPTQGMFFRSAQADRWPEAFVPIEIGLLGRLRAGRRLLRRLKSAFSGASRALARRASAFAPIEIGLLGRLRAGRRLSCRLKSAF